MSGHYIDLRVHFSREEEDGYSHYSPESVETINSTISERDMNSIGESAGQSDTYTVNVSNTLLLALGQFGTIQVDD